MRHFLTLIVLLSFLTGCAGIQTPLGTYRFTSAESSEPTEPTKPVPKAKEDPKKLTHKEKFGMSEPVMVLMAIGAGFMLTSIMAMNYDDGMGHEEFTVITGGTGILIWGVAGIVHVAE